MSRRTVAVKALLLALTAIIVSTAPLWTLERVVHVAAWLAVVVMAAAVTFLVLTALEFWRGFRRFEAWTAAEARRLFGGLRRRRVFGRR